MVELISYGENNGPLKDVDVILDCRVLSNPWHWMVYRDMTGNDIEVQEMILDQSGEDAAKLLSMAVVVAKDNENARIAFKCYGGRHRSVTMANVTKVELTELGIPCTVTHRDIP